jgi:hypothetical protein
MKSEKSQCKIKNYLKLKGANMGIDLASNSKKINWKQDKCPWNKKDKIKKHKCAVKNISICKYFKGIEYPDVVLCNFPEK